MTTLESTQIVPLIVWEDGSIRVTGSRVTLDSIIQSYQLGETPEQIAGNFPSISLADIYAAITYYLTHTAEVDEYLREREREADEMQQRIESDPAYQVRKNLMRERLSARWSGRQSKAD